MPRYPKTIEECLPSTPHPHNRQVRPFRIVLLKFQGYHVPYDHDCPRGVYQAGQMFEDHNDGEKFTDYYREFKPKLVAIVEEHDAKGPCGGGFKAVQLDAAGRPKDFLPHPYESRKWVECDPTTGEPLAYQVSRVDLALSLEEVREAGQSLVHSFLKT